MKIAGKGKFAAVLFAVAGWLAILGDNEQSSEAGHMDERMVGLLVMGGFVIAFACFVTYMSNRQEMLEAEAKKRQPRRLRSSKRIGLASPRRSPRDRESRYVL